MTEQEIDNTIEKYKDLLKDDACIFIKGSPSNREDDSGALKMIAGDIYPLAQIREKLSRHINILLDSNQNDIKLLQKLKNFSAENKGGCSLMIHLRSENGNIQRIRASRIGVNPSQNYINGLREIFGRRNVWVS